MLQGVNVLQVEAMPICVRLKSRSVKPVARSIARLGVCLTPSNTTLEYGRGSTFGFDLGIVMTPWQTRIVPQSAPTGA